MEFDELITSPARLRIVAALVPGETLAFTDLKRATGLADGNLHVQARKLAEAEYIVITKESRGKRSLTLFRITELGLESLRLHVRKLQNIVAMESGEIRPKPASGGSDPSQVWR